MKEVWIFEKCVHYDGSEVISVHETREGAKEAAKTACKEQNRLDGHLDIEPILDHFSEECRGYYTSQMSSDVEFHFYFKELLK